MTTFAAAQLLDSAAALRRLASRIRHEGRPGWLGEATQLERIAGDHETRAAALGPPAEPASLVAWLRQQLDADEAAARAASPAPWSYYGIDAISGSAIYDATRCIANVDWDVTPTDQRIRRDVSSPEADANGYHIARWDPARVLAEVAAKRAVLTEYQLILATDAVERATSQDEVRIAARDLIVKTLRMVLLHFADAYVAAGRPGFDPAWAAGRS